MDSGIVCVWGGVKAYDFDIEFVCKIQDVFAPSTPKVSEGADIFGLVEFFQLKGMMREVDMSTLLVENNIWSHHFTQLVFVYPLKMNLPIQDFDFSLVRDDGVDEETCEGDKKNEHNFFKDGELGKSFVLSRNVRRYFLEGLHLLKSGRSIQIIFKCMKFIYANRVQADKIKQ